MFFYIFWLISGIYKNSSNEYNGFVNKKQYNFFINTLIDMLEACLNNVLYTLTETYL